MRPLTYVRPHICFCFASSINPVFWPDREREPAVAEATMACEGLVNWRGKPINTKVHGGVRAAWYLYCKFIYLIGPPVTYEMEYIVK